MKTTLKSTCRINIIQFSINRLCQGLSSKTKVAEHIESKVYTINLSICHDCNKRSEFSFHTIEIFGPWSQCTGNNPKSFYFLKTDPRVETLFVISSKFGNRKSKHWGGNLETIFEGVYSYLMRSKKTSANKICTKKIEK